MRVMLASALAGLASACAATPPLTPAADAAAQARSAAAVDRPRDSLPVQDLPPGACGLFLFGLAEPFPFLVFEDETGGQALVLQDRRVQRLGVIEAQGVFVPGERFVRRYGADPAGRRYRLEGRVGEETGSGPRLEQVLLRVTAPDGTETVRPLGGVRSCAPEAG